MLSIPSLAAAGQGKDQATQKVDEMTQKSQQVLNNAKSRSAGEANDGITNAMYKSNTGRDSALAALDRENNSNSKKDSDSKNESDSKEGKQKAKEQVTEKTQKRDDALMQALDRTPEEANDGLNNAIDRSRTGPDHANSALGRDWHSSSPENGFGSHAGGFDSGRGFNSGGRSGFAGGNPGGHGRGH